MGDWLVGMCTRVGEEFSLADATADYKKMVTDFDEGGLSRARLHGPGVRRRQSSGASAASRVHADVLARKARPSHHDY